MCSFALNLKIITLHPIHLNGHVSAFGRVNVRQYRKELLQISSCRFSWWVSEKLLWNKSRVAVHFQPYWNPPLKSAVLIHVWIPEPYIPPLFQRSFWFANNLSANLQIIHQGSELIAVNHSPGVKAKTKLTTFKFTMGHSKYRVDSCITALSVARLGINSPGDSKIVKRHPSKGSTTSHNSAYYQEARTLMMMMMMMMMNN